MRNDTEKTLAVRSSTLIRNDVLQTGYDRRCAMQGQRAGRVTFDKEQLSRQNRSVCQGDRRHRLDVVGAARRHDGERGIGPRALGAAR